MKTGSKNKKKSVICIIISALLGAVIIAGVCVMIFLPVTFKLDKSLIVKNPDYNVYVVEKDGYTSLIKKNASGQAIDAEFKIIGFTDVHLDAKKEKGDVTFQYIVRNIVAEKPDMVVFVGDTITAGINRRRAKQLAKTMEELGVYWDLVLGNHEGDNKWSITRAQMVKLFSKYPHCLIDAETKTTTSGEKVWGNGNHVINLLDSHENVIRSLYFIDGGSDMSEEDMIKYDAEFSDKNSNDYDYVKPSQITWYKETVAKINALNGATNGATVKSTVFDHIPLPEYRIAYDKLTGETAPTMNVPVYNVPDADGDYILEGQRREIICSSGHNSGFFDEILNSGSTDSVICGHDHINDFILCYKGVILAYNEPSGYSSYNLVSKKLADDLMQGYSIYKVAADGTFSMQQKHNCDIYPAEQEKIKELYR